MNPLGLLSASGVPDGDWLLGRAGSGRPRRQDSPEASPQGLAIRWGLWVSGVGLMPMPPAALPLAGPGSAREPLLSVCGSSGISIPDSSPQHFGGKRLSSEG